MIWHRVEVDGQDLIPTHWDSERNTVCGETIDVIMLKMSKPTVNDFREQDDICRTCNASPTDANKSYVWMAER